MIPTLGYAFQNLSFIQVGCVTRAVRFVPDQFQNVSNLTNKTTVTVKMFFYSKMFLFAGVLQNCLRFFSMYI